MDTPSSITITTIVHAPIEAVWESWTKPEHITKWAFASDDWEAPHAENDVRVGGIFTTHMQAKDRSEGFDFTGVYTDVKELRHLAYNIEDGRQVDITFEETPEGIVITQTFEMEDTNSEEKQRSGWQSILDTFKAYTEKTFTNT